MRALPLLPLLLILGLGGCRQAPNARLLGKWTFDHDYTVAHLPKELTASAAPAATPKPTPPGGSPGDLAAVTGEVGGMLNGMMNTLKPQLAAQLIAKMDGQSLTISPKLITGSSGVGHPYEVVEHATADTWSLKGPDGTIDTFAMEDGRLADPTEGDVHFKMYFKRVGP